MLAILACQPAPAPPSPSPNISIEEALTVVIQSLTAQAPVSTLPNSVSLTMTTPPSLTLEATGTSTVLPTGTVTPSPTVPLASVSRPTNCRTGPSVSFDQVIVVDVGVTYQVIGKYTPDNYWIVTIPGVGQCWLWGQYASIAGNIGSLPEMVSPPTPTPAVGSVNGEIIDVEGNKVSNVLVTAQLSKLTYTTNSDGTYIFSSLPPGREFITIEYGSHNSQFQSVNVLAGNTVTANFVLHPIFWDNPLTITVEGLILLNSEPAAGVSVWLWAKNASTITDSAGHYRIKVKVESLKGPYLILAELGNLQGGVEWYPLQMPTAPDIILLP